jgi:predicted transposase YdaD
MKERKSDILWKMVMEEVFDDLLRFLYADADQVYDLERGFEFLDKELGELYPEPDKKSATRFADKLVKVYHRDGEEEVVLLHVEIQGDTSNKSEFAERMYEYFIRIRLKHPGIPVSAVAIFTGQDGRRMPTRYEYAYRQTSLVYEYHSFSIRKFTDKKLKESTNPFAVVVLAAKASLKEGKIPEKALLKRKTMIAKLLFSKGFCDKKVWAIFKFLENLVLFEDPAMNLTFREQIKSSDKNNAMGVIEFVKQEGIEIGLEKGLEQGMENGKRDFVGNLLRETNLPIEKIAVVAAVTVEFVNEIKAGMIAQ